MPTIREQVLAAFATKTGASRAELPTKFDSLPVVNMTDGDDVIEQVEYRSEKKVMAVRLEKIEAFYDPARSIDVARSIQANILLGDLILAAMAGDRTLGGLCEGIDYSAGGVIYADAGSNLVGAFAVFNITYRSDVGDPSTNTYAW